VHCIVGENGSGKSTLVKILAGVHQPDSGRMEMEGRELVLTSPLGSHQAGIATVFQEVLVVEPRSILDNVWIGTDGLVRRRRSTEDKRRRAAEVLEELLGRQVDLNQPVETLSLSDRQACCITRAIVREPRVLILDESTSALDVATRDRLFSLIRRLSGEGVVTVFISHRMDEIGEIGTRCTVMRSGNTVATLTKSETTPSKLVRLMTGDDHLTQESSRMAAAKAPTGEPLLSARGVRLGAGTEPIDFELRSGELVGLAGLEGHGQDAFLQALWGGPHAAGQVVCIENGSEVEVDSPATAAANQIVYVPRERRAEAIFESKSIRENFGMPTLDDDRRGLLVHSAHTRARLQRWIRDLGITLRSDNDLITTLSGGNQQKVVLARWLTTDPKVVLLNDPTRGIDIGAKRDLYALLADLVNEGCAVVMLSTELDELIELSDRVLVFREHEVFKELSRKQLSREALVHAYFGDSAKAAG
jgi:ABC-type sugar transport system ATPase subunit